MRKVISSVLYSAFGGSNKEAFQGFGKSNINLAKQNPWILIFSFIIVEILLLIFGKFLWNEIAINIVPGLKPIYSIWQILGLSILIKLLTN